LGDGSGLHELVALLLLEGIGELLHLDVELVAALELALHSLAELQHRVHYRVLLPTRVPQGVVQVHSLHDLLQVARSSLLQRLELIVVLAAVDNVEDLLYRLLSLGCVDHDLIDPEDGVDVEHPLLLLPHILGQDDRHHAQSLEGGFEVFLDIPLGLHQEAHHEYLGEQSCQPVEVVLLVGAQQFAQ
jgi:hypothetical protein